MLSVREVPWHRLGTILDAPPTVAEAIRLAGLEWTAQLDPTFVAEPFDDAAIVALLSGAGLDGDTITQVSTLLPDFVPGAQLATQAVRRSDSREIIGEVGAGFRPVQNAEALEWFTPLLEEGLVTLETAGSLWGGSKVWIMARLAADAVDICRDDAIDPFLLLTHGHDGKLALRAGLSPVRVVCNNTLSLALGREGLSTIRHTRNAAAMLDDARSAIRAEITRFEQAADSWRFLASVPATDKDLEAYVRGVFGTDGEEAALTAEIPESGGAGSRVLPKVRELWEGGRGAKPGTWWAAYNAVTEYLSHERGDDDARRFEALHFGEGRRLNARAISFALAFADDRAPVIELPPLPALPTITAEPFVCEDAAPTGEERAQ